MGFLADRRYKKDKLRIHQELSQHLFNVTLAEEKSPTHRKLRKGATLDEAKDYLDYRMSLREKWIDNFFVFRPEIDPKIKMELTEEVNKDSEVLQKNILSHYSDADLT